jgi:hypothetical protein
VTIAALAPALSRRNLTWGAVIGGLVLIGLLGSLLSIPYLGSFFDWLISRVTALNDRPYAVPIAFRACAGSCANGRRGQHRDRGMILTSGLRIPRRRLSQTGHRRAVGALAGIGFGHRRVLYRAPCLAVDHDRGGPDYQRHGHQHPRLAAVFQPALRLDDRPLEDEHTEVRPSGGSMSIIRPLL